MNQKNSFKGIIFLVTAAVVWGFAFVAQAIGAGSVTPFYFNFARYILGTVSVIPLILIFEKNANDRQMRKNTFIMGIVAGIILFTASYLQQSGIEMTDSAGKSGFITGLYMIIVPIIGIFLGNKTGIKTWIGALLGIIGLFLVCMGGGKFTLTFGDLLLILCALVFAVHILLIDRFSQKIYSLRFATTQFATCTVLNLIGTLIFEEISFAPIRDALIPVLYCGIMSVGVAYTCQILGQKYSEPTSASIILSTESVFSAIGGAIILKERMEPAGYLGCALIFCGIILSQLKSKKSDNPSDIKKQ